MIKIDATGKKIGRIASEAAKSLMGKNSTSFSRNKLMPTPVEIVNASKTDISEKKKAGNDYTVFTGFRGGIYTEKLGEVVTKKGVKEVLERAIYGMLPKNKLTKGMMKNLKIME